MSDESETNESAPTKKSSELFQPTATTPTAPPGMLTRPSDMPARPGFRSPANNKSKAQRKKK